MSRHESDFIDPGRIQAALAEGPGDDPGRVRALLDKARALAGLTAEEAAVLARVRDLRLEEEILHAARAVKETIYGPRLVLFAPLYLSNRCANDCAYCAFRISNRALPRRTLTPGEVTEEATALVRQGHKRLLLVAGEAAGPRAFDHLLASIDAVYAAQAPPSGEIRRVNVNVAPLDVDRFARLKACRIGTYQLFQETYHRPTYARCHPRGPKADYDRRLTVMDRAMEAGIDDVGIGVLFGLHDWRFELLALLAHAEHLESRYGAGPHTISVPRLEPADGAELAGAPPAPVSDRDFKRIVALLRLAVPYTGLILSTREGPAMRREALALGVSQISAGSRTNPGGYLEGEGEAGSQFQLGDHRALDEVVRDVASLGYVPSFCTGCYRLGRTGADFMDLARPGVIRRHCNPNALSTYLEYLLDYAGPETRAAGLAHIEARLEGMEPAVAARTRWMLGQVADGQRDVYV